MSLHLFNRIAVTMIEVQQKCLYSTTEQLFANIDTFSGIY